MLSITVKVEMRRFLDKIALARQELPKSVAIALTETVKGVRDDLKQAEQSSFAHVNAYTLAGFYVTFADKRALQDGAVVGIKRNQTRWLLPEIAGGTRTSGIETYLSGIIPSGMYAVPTKNAKFIGGSNGRVSVSWLKQIADKVRSDRGKIIKRKNSLLYFALTHQEGRLPPGIYSKRGGQIVPLIIFVRTAHYQPRFDFYGVAEASARRRFPVQFAAALDRAKSKLR